MQSGLTNIVLYSEALLSQKTRPDARLSLKFPQPKLPVKTLLGEEKENKEKTKLSGLRWIKVSH